MLQRQTSHSFFSKFLPTVGHVTNMLTMLSGAGITYMALTITGSDEDNHSSTSSKILGISGATLHSIIAVGMYFYSDATNMLTDMGFNLDQIFCRMRTHNHYVRLDGDHNDLLRHSSCKIKSVSLLSYGVILANVTISSISQYQQSILLINKYLDLFPEMPETEKERNRIMLQLLVADMFAISSAYAFLAFQGSFAAKFINHLTKKVNSQSNASLRESLQDGNSVLFSYRRSTPQVEESSPRRTLRLRAQSA